MPHACPCFLNYTLVVFELVTFQLQYDTPAELISLNVSPIVQDQLGGFKFFVLKWNGRKNLSYFIRSEFFITDVLPFLYFGCKCEKRLWYFREIWIPFTIFQGDLNSIPFFVLNLNVRKNLLYITKIWIPLCRQKISSAYSSLGSAIPWRCEKLWCRTQVDAMFPSQKKVIESRFWYF